ncbi:MAG: metal-dependent transcriptional regulator [Chloroflexi bacterium]|nr:metal-dependent transcriptional regulator [Chloroflexota bacterium]
MTTTTRRRATAHDRISNIAENYLQSLYKLREEGLRPSAGNLTDFIRRLPREEGVGTSLPSILGMLRRMAKEGLVTIKPNKEVELTERGEAAAESIVRRHRLAERLVVDILGLDVARAHIEAHRLEHAISPELEKCIQERLGRPATNPFGRPIPGNAPKSLKGTEVCLADAEVGRDYVVDRVPEEDPQLLAYLIGCGVMPGAQLRVAEQSKYRGVLVFKTDSCESSMGYDAARFVWLRSAPSNGMGEVP